MLSVSVNAAVINVPGDQPTIQAAVNAAIPGDTVQVAAGVYTEWVTINKALTLNGPNAGINPNTQLRLPEAEIHTDNLDTHQAVLIDSSNVTVDGFEIYGPNGSVKDIGAIGCTSTGPLTNVNIQNNRVFRTAGGTDWNGDGIQLVPPSDAAASIYITDNRVEAGLLNKGNNAITIADNAYRQAHGGTWVVGSTPRVTIEGNDLRGHGKLYLEGIGISVIDNEFHGEWGPIEVRGAKDIVIDQNTMDAQADVGIYAWSPLDASGHGLLTDVRITRNLINGMVAEVAQQFTDSGTAVILGGVTNAYVSCNTFTNNAGSGVVIGGEGYDHFYPEDWLNWGIMLEVGPYQPVNNIIIRNNLVGNAAQGVNVDATVTSGTPINARYNWWGAADGPGPVGPGSGDDVSTDVTYAPWLTAPVVPVTANVALEEIVAGPVTRDITFTSVATSGAPLVVVEPIVFTGGVGSKEVCMPEANLKAKDAQHSLSSTQYPWNVAPGEYVASFVGVGKLTGADANNDDKDDIWDFGIFMAQLGTTGHPYPMPALDADFTDSGTVNKSDFLLLYKHFLQRGPSPKISITVNQLAAIVGGVTNARKADLNRDGWVNLTDVAIYRQRLAGR
jgi:hypothetical protein